MALSFLCSTSFEKYRQVISIQKLETTFYTGKLCLKSMRLFCSMEKLNISTRCFENVWHYERAMLHVV